VFGYSHVKVDWSINLCVKLNYRIKKLQILTLSRINFGGKSITIESKQTCYYQFYASKINFDFSKSENKHTLKWVWHLISRFVHVRKIGNYQQLSLLVASVKNDLTSLA